MHLSKKLIMLNLHKIKEFQDIFSFFGESCIKILSSVISNHLEAFGKKDDLWN